MPSNCDQVGQIRMRRSHALGMGLIGATAVLLVVLSGCQKTALRPKDTRSQFDQYDQARNQRAQPFLEDEFGRRTPNLSERLRERND